MIQPLRKTVWRFFKKLGIKPLYDPAILSIYPEETKIERDTYIPLFIVALFTIARTWKQTRCPLTDEWIKKLLYIYTMKYSVQFSSVPPSCPTLCDPKNRSTPGLPVHHQLPEFMQTHVHRVGDAIQTSHPLSSPSPPAPNPSQHHPTIKRNTFESVLMRWMNLEPIIQSEVRWKEKDKYYILTHIYLDSRKMVLKNLILGSSGETDIENRLMDMGKGEERMRCMGRVTWKLTLQYVK